jgi:hypothetical protein
MIKRDSSASTSVSCHEDGSCLRSKRRKVDGAQGRLSDQQDRDISYVPGHPWGIKPIGNAYSADTDLGSAAGFFGRLLPEALLCILESLDASALIALGSTCKLFFAYTRHEDLWKTLFIE